RVERVHEGIEAASGGDARVELPHRSGGGIARVGEERLALSRQLGVEPLKTTLRHVHLAPDLERAWEFRRDRHGERNTGNGLDVGGDVFTDIAVAPGRSDAVAAVLVEEAHGQAVDLQLGAVLELDVSQRPTHPLVEFATLPSPRGGGNRLHGCCQSLTMGARLTARIFMPTLSNFTMISSSVLVIVLLSTVPRPQARWST